MKILRLAAGALISGAIVFAALPASAGMVSSSKFNHPGNILISDQFNNRVIEADKNGNIVWSWGLGPMDFSANSILGVNDAERVGQDTLMAGTGIPAGVDPNCPAGCADSRVRTDGAAHGAVATGKGSRARISAHAGPSKAAINPASIGRNT